VRGYRGSGGEEGGVERKEIDGRIAGRQGTGYGE